MEEEASFLTQTAEEKDWQQKIKVLFPSGVVVVPDRDDLHYPMIDLFVKIIDGKTVVRGWAYPNKDMYFNLTDVEQRGESWVLKSGGRTYAFRPLSKAKGNDLREQMKAV